MNLPAQPVEVPGAAADPLQLLQVEAVFVVFIGLRQFAALAALPQLVALQLIAAALRQHAGDGAMEAAVEGRITAQFQPQLLQIDRQHIHALRRQHGGRCTDLLLQQEAHFTDQLTPARLADGPGLAVQLQLDLPITTEDQVKAADGLALAQ